MDADITIIGAGVVGLAIAEKVSAEHDNVFLIEKHLSFRQETSSRNSEVIHAGIYYTKDSLKALFSPSTGIVDSHSLMKHYETNSYNNGLINNTI